jgi:hypothetical protein
MKWLVAVCKVQGGFLSNPGEFMSHPEKRAQPGWAWGIVEAEDEYRAYYAGEEAFSKGTLQGQQPGDVLTNWYVAPLSETTKG